MALGVSLGGGFSDIGRGCQAVNLLFPNIFHRPAYVGYFCFYYFLVSHRCSYCHCCYSHSTLHPRGSLQAPEIANTDWGKIIVSVEQSSTFLNYKVLYHFGLNL